MEPDKQKYENAIAGKKIIDMRGKSTRFHPDVQKIKSIYGGRIVRNKITKKLNKSGRYKTLHRWKDNLYITTNPSPDKKLMSEHNIKIV